MTAVFMEILNMSLVASYVAVAAILLRFLFKKAPKIYSYVLWSIVLIRMLIPFSFESGFSILPEQRTVQDVGNYYKERLSGMANYYKTNEDRYVSTSRNETVSEPTMNQRPVASPSQDIKPVLGTIVWVLGMVILLMYSALYYIRLKRRLRTAMRVEGNIYESDRIITPFVLGFIKPKIYIPLGLSKEEYAPIIHHEMTHIRRRDYLIKPLYFLAVMIHWFNPLMWLSYYLMSKDMEMSCDEAVMRGHGEVDKKEYARLLLNLSSKQSGLLSPIAFGENNTHSRVKHVLKYKKTTLGIGLLALILVFVAGYMLLTNPKSSKVEKSIEEAPLHEVEDTIVDKQDTEVTETESATDTSSNSTGDNLETTEEIIEEEVDPMETFDALEADEIKLGYIKHMFLDFDKNSVSIFEAMIINPEDTEIMTKYGYTEEDGPGGFIVHQLDESPVVYTLSEEVKLAMMRRLGGYELMMTDEDAFFLRAKEWRAEFLYTENETYLLANIYIKDGIIVGMAEFYIP